MGEGQGLLLPSPDPVKQNAGLEGPAFGTWFSRPAYFQSSRPEKATE